MAKQVTLSPSALSLFKDCARCFWLEKVKASSVLAAFFRHFPAVWTA